MKLVFFFLKCIFVVCLFMLGVSVADKECLKESIIGVQVVGTENEDLINHISCMDVDSAEDFCQKIKAYDADLEVYVDLQYFEASAQGNILIPGGMYETVFVNLDSGLKTVSSFTISIAHVNTRFYASDEPIITYVQNSYVSFLSFLGTAEKMVINFQDML